MRAERADGAKRTQLDKKFPPGRGRGARWRLRLFTSGNGCGLPQLPPVGEWGLRFPLCSGCGRPALDDMVTVSAPMLSLSIGK